MTGPEVYDRLTGIFHDIFADDTLVLAPNTTAADVPGWDSMKMIGIVVAVEHRFAIKLRSREVNSLACVGDLATLIQSKLPA